ncbi:MAG: Rpn family recombination-promoting nuclease/putative transposase [Tannerella sp.]|jgi:predicted transposase/invertase (TIGR01784 family)|nr:Rpn family recombination-promoting nuclease/putative transposase [Tannerella sp.]
MGKDNFIRFDWAAKRLLRQKANFVVLEGFLSTLLDEPIRIERILESEGNKITEDDKFNRVDILAENHRGELLIIEVQNNRELDYFHRMLYGASKAITEYIHESEPFLQVKKIYSINIVYFDLGQGKDYVYHGRTEFRGIHENDVLQLSASQQKQFACEKAGDLYPEYYVLRVEKFNEIAVTPLDEWISFLKTGEIPEDVRAPGLAEARQRLRIDRMEKTEREAYHSHLEAVRYQRSVIRTSLVEGRIEGIKEGEAIGLEKGEAIGLEKGRKEKEEALATIVVNAYRNGLTLEQIRAFSNQSREEIVNLLERNGINV